MLQFIVPIILIIAGISLGVFVVLGVISSLKTHHKIDSFYTPVEVFEKEIEPQTPIKEQYEPR